MNDPLVAVRELFATHAARTLLVESTTGRQVSYAEFEQLALAAAGALVAQGLRPGERVGLLLTNAIDFAALYFGCLASGITAVPINPGLHAREVSFIVQHAGLALLVYNRHTAPLLAQTEVPPALPRLLLAEPDQPDGGKPRLTLTTAPALPRSAWQRTIAPDELFAITFTSGTTSQPKGVCHRAACLLGNADAFNRFLGTGPQNRFLHVMNMAYMAGFLNTLLCPFMAGASVVLCPAFNAQTALRFWRQVIPHQVDTFWLAPTMLNVLLKVDRTPEAPAYCRDHRLTLCVGTAPLPQRTRQEFEARYGVELFESYGLSELLLLSGNCATHARRPGSVGKTLPAVGVLIRDEEGQALPPGGDGEICIQTPHAAAGYLDFATGRPRPPADPWFATGDIGHVDADGYLYITDRKKDLIIRGGLNLSPRAVEETLLAHPAVAQVAVVGLPHAFYGEEVAAVIQFHPGHTLPERQADLQSWCRQRLSPEAQPTRWFARDTLPTNPTGKIMKAELRRQLIAEQHLHGT